MMLTDLDDALRAGGIGFWESPGWQGRGHGPMSGVRGILIHHTAGGGPGDWRTVQNGRPDLAGPLAHMTFERDGGVRLLAAGQCWHAGQGTHPRIGTNNGNAWMIGIEGVAAGTPGSWSPAQRAGYPRVAAALCRHYGLPAAAVIGHKEWATPRGRKSDPGDWDMNQFRNDVAGHLRGGVTTHDIGDTTMSPRKPKENDRMIERPLVPGANVGTIVCPTGSASGVVARAWLSVRVAGGGRAQAWFQMSADSDGPAPGAGAPVDWTLQSAKRAWVEVPNGTEYIEFNIDAHGFGSLAIEMEAK